MKVNYFTSAGLLNSHVRNYPSDCFHIEQQSHQCTCGKIRDSYEVIDRQDNDILERLVLCPRCAQPADMTVNGVSVCTIGEERYVFFNLTPRPIPGNRYCQYDYRHTDGELFSAVAPTLEQCRAKRDKWLLRKSTKTADN